MSVEVGAGRPGGITLGDVVRAALPSFSQIHRLPAHHWKALRAIAACRTPALGGHQYQCAHCGQPHFVPHSCRNRHCPTCQGLNGAQWLERQAEDLLPIPYFHVVFTLPHALNPLIRHNQQRLYNLLFTSATATLLEFGRNNLKAQLGITAILHTWSQTQGDHYHLHCIVTGGGLALDGSAWVARPPGWLFPVRALSIVFRAKFRDGLQQLWQAQQLQFPEALPSLSEPANFARWLRLCCRPKWVVYAKRPFAGPETVLAYLSRYTHRVSITNRRLESLDRHAQTVTFSYKDYAHEGQRRSMTLSLDEFLRRFCLHLLPPRFVKIRHYGLLANRDRSLHLAQARERLGALPAGLEPEARRPIKHLEPRPLLCPHCGQPTLVLVRIIRPPRNHPPPLADTS